MRLDNTGKTYTFTWNRNAAEASSFPKEVSEALTHMNNLLGAYGKLKDIVTLLKNGRRFAGEHGSEVITWDLHIWDPFRSLHMEPSPLRVLTDSSRKGLVPEALPRLPAEGMEELDRVYSTDSLERF